jgi:thiamine biosynthesis lipoprotein ApbE
MPSPQHSRRRFIRGLGALGLLQLAPTPLVASQYPSAEQARQLAFPSAEHFQRQRKIATKEQAQAVSQLLGGRRVSRIFTYHEASRGGELLGYTVEGAVLGKHKDIDYLVALDPSLAVAHIEILAYRESYGYQIRSSRFKEQFYGKRVSDPLRLGDEITNIATATISCRSLITAVREVLAQASVLIGGQAHHSQTRQLPSAVCCRTTVAMGTLLSIEAEGDCRMGLAVSEAFAEVQRIEARLSRFEPGSEVSRLNESAGKGACPLSAETFALLQRAEGYRRFSNNRFFVCSKEDRAAPVGLNPVLRRADLPEAGEVDLGGIAKGFALDSALEVLKQHGAQRALLNFGGHLLAMGRWEVVLAGSGHRMGLHDASIATTNLLERGDHLRGTPTRMSTSVLAQTAEAADAWSTALHLCPDGAAFALARQHGLQLLGTF